MAVSPSSASNPEISSSLTKNQNKKKKKKNLALKTQLSPSSSPAKRTKSPGIRVVGGRIYDSENGKSCHQCRQKTRDFVASCKNAQKKPCTIKFCHKCLLNRYGENAETMAALDDWKCPKCRGICNCSFCMRKRGQKPTGILAHTAKATGLSSVSELLNLKGSESLSSEKIVEDSQTDFSKSTKSDKVSLASKRKHDKENSSVEQVDSNLQCKKPVTADAQGKLLRATKKIENHQKKSREINIDENVNEGGPVTTNAHGKLLTATKKIKNHQKKSGQINIEENVNEGGNIDNGEVDGKTNNETLVSGNISLDNIEKTEVVDKIVKAKPLPLPILKRHREEDAEVGIMLPQGVDLKTVAGIELSPEDVGPALQFLEFCSAFGEVLDLKKGQPESVLRELTRGRIGRRGAHSTAVQFHIKLLSLIENDLGEESSLSGSPSSGNSWLQALGKCISGSQYALKELQLDSFNNGAAGYKNLDASKKLMVLNFICDETLGTEELRSWMDKENSKYIEKKKEANEKVLAAKEKEKSIKQKLKDEMAQAILSSRNGPLSISEHDNLVLKIRSETEKAHVEMLEAMDLVPKKKQRPDAVRSEPMFLDGNGHIYWTLKGYSSRSHILLQDIGNWELVTPQDKWFIYEDEQEKIVEGYISSLRIKKHRAQMIRKTLALQRSKESANHDSSINLSFPKSATEEG